MCHTCIDDLDLMSAILPGLASNNDLFLRYDMQTFNPLKPSGAKCGTERVKVHSKTDRQSV